MGNTSNNETIQVTKNLATCSGVEFLVQTNKIRHEATEWLKATGAMELRKRKAEGKKSVTDDMTKEQIEAINEENRKLDVAQAKKNISDMLDACLENNPEKTLRVLAMMCFIDPNDAEKVAPTDLLLHFGIMLGNEGVISFFLSFLKWEGMLG